MCDAAMIFEYGLVGAFDTVASMRGEDVAIVTPTASTSDDAASDVCSEDSMNGISYSEIQFSALALSCQLSNRFGVCRGDRVLIVCGGHVAAEIVAMIACLRIGAVFVPLDDTWFLTPSLGRVREIVGDCAPHAAIVAAEDDSNFRIHGLNEVNLHRCAPLFPNGTIVEWDASISDAAMSFIRNSYKEALNAPIYVMYTSGSTGCPKGVMGSHKGLINRICWQYKHYPWAPREVICRRTPLTFVDAMAEIFSPLLAAIPIWCPSLGMFKEGGLCGIAHEANSVGVTRIILLPSQLDAACRTNRQLGVVWPNLMHVSISGEECPMALIKLCKSVLPNVTLVNMYGSTEVSGDVTFVELCNPKTSHLVNVIPEKPLCVPIGTALPGNYLYVVSFDPLIQAYVEVPEGSIGELLVIGIHVTHGYFNNEEFSEAKYLNRPWTHLRLNGFKDVEDYGTAFLTGDLVLRTLTESTEGTAFCYYYMGRRDRVTKIRGVRVDLDEIERNILSVLEISAGISVLRFNVPGNLAEDRDYTILLLCIECEIAQQLCFETGYSIKEFLRIKLIGEFVPNFVLPMTAFPRTESNKIDRPQLLVEATKMYDSLLKFTSDKKKESKTLESLNESAKYILSIFKDALPYMALAVVENMLFTELEVLNSFGGKVGNDYFFTLTFFQMGGDSISAVPVLYRLRKFFQSLEIDLPENPLMYSIAMLAARTGALQSLGGDELGNTSERDQDKSVVLAFDNEISLTRNSPSLGMKRNFMQMSSLSSCDANLPQNCKMVSTVNYLDRRKFSCSSVPFMSESISLLRNFRCATVISWSRKFQKCVDSAPLIVSFGLGNHSVKNEHTCVLYIGSHFGDYCALDSETGEILWRLCLGEHIEGSGVYAETFDSAGIRRSVIVVASYKGIDKDCSSTCARPISRQEGTLGSVWCIDAKAGDIFWVVDTPGEVKGTPLLLQIEKLLIVGAHDGYVYCICLLTGTILCRSDCGGAVFAAPVFRDSGDIYVATTNGVLHAMHLSVSEQCSALSLRWSFNVGGGVFAVPIVDRFGTFCRLLLCTTSGEILQLEDKYNGSHDLILLWKVHISSSPIFSSPSVVPHVDLADTSRMVIFGSHDGYLRCLTTLSGALQWELFLGSVVFSSPFCEHVCLNGATKIVCAAATAAGVFFLVDVRLGMILGKIDLNGEIYSSPVIFKNKVYIGCRNNNVYCLDIIDVVDESSSVV